MITKDLVLAAVPDPSGSWKIRRGCGSHPHAPRCRRCSCDGSAPRAHCGRHQRSPLHFRWWIRAWRLIGGSIAHRINHEAPINHAKQELHSLLTPPCVTRDAVVARVETVPAQPRPRCSRRTTALLSPLARAAPRRVPARHGTEAHPAQDFGRATPVRIVSTTSVMNSPVIGRCPSSSRCSAAPKNRSSTTSRSTEAAISPRAMARSSMIRC